MRKERIVNGVSVMDGTRNIYADLGLADSEVMLIKAQLVAKIAEIITKQGLTQEQAAEILGLTQPKVSRLLKGQFRGVSERRLLECLTRLGRDVEIVVKAAPRNSDTGRVTVHFA